MFVLLSLRAALLIPLFDLVVRLCRATVHYSEIGKLYCLQLESIIRDRLFNEMGCGGIDFLN